MKFEIEKNGNYTLINSKVEKLDSFVTPELKSIFEKLNNEGEKYIVLDLAIARYCDSLGLTTLLAGNKLCHRLGGALVICNIQPFIKKILFMSQLDTVLKITSSRDEALKLLTEIETEKNN